MNIFALSQDPKEAAKAHGDKHVVKMILESCQMLYTAHWICAHPELLLHKAPIKVAAAQKLLSVPECISQQPLSVSVLLSQGFVQFISTIRVLSGFAQVWPIICG